MNLKHLSMKHTSYYLAKKLVNYKKETHAQKLIYYYSLQILIGTFYEFSFIFGLAYILGMFYETLLTSLVFITIRFFAGGYHADTYPKCFVLTSALMIGLTLLSKLIQPIYYLNLNMLFLLLSIFLIYKYSPCDTINKPIISKTKFNKLKIESLIVTFIWFVISVSLILLNHHEYATLIGVGALAESLTTTPFIANNAPIRKKNMYKACT